MEKNPSCWKVRGKTFIDTSMSFISNIGLPNYDVLTDYQKVFQHYRYVLNLETMRKSLPITKFHFLRNGNYYWSFLTCTFTFMPFLASLVMKVIRFKKIKKGWKEVLFHLPFLQWIHNSMEMKKIQKLISSIGKEKLSKNSQDEIKELEGNKSKWESELVQFKLQESIFEGENILQLLSIGQLMKAVMKSI